ncbi:ATP-dependent nuclease [Burkholderia multivorans]|uniref:ATP-dependent nuclease n=1 Tax=Burkholderia multivorans TaxID=87883 RepID=UPI000AABAFC4|nr:AAA family ATPase [Burkholderia multivorans]
MLQHIKIKNFRSLRDLSMQTKALTVLVGSNDEGKSNVLRALDLFFNHDRPTAVPLLWERDFCAFAPKVKGRAAEIEIALTFKLPDNYSLGERVVWTKKWRQQGIHLDEILTESKSSLPGRSRADSFLRAMRYDYVPAVKGEDYFQRLLAAVYDMLDATVRDSIRAAATGFTENISGHTRTILSELESRIGLKSEIQLPTDLRTLFSELEFRSQRQEYFVNLSQRGDGLKVRHIPIILRWLAEQANHLASKGRPRVVSLWGYEEPENNLEIKRAFDLAKEFLDTSATIPTLITTHSPVFYTAFKDANPDVVAIHEISFQSQNGSIATSRSGQSDAAALDSATGLLDLLRPYMKSWEDQVAILQDRLNENIDTTTPTIFVEGPSDKIILDALLERFFPTDVGRVQVRCSLSNGGGHAWVKDSLVAWHYARAEANAVGLFDADEATKPSIDAYKALVLNNTDGKTKTRFMKLKASGFVVQLKRKNFNVPLALEELYPIEAWAFAQQRGWLVRRNSLLKTYGYTKTDIAFDDYVGSVFRDDRDVLVITSCVSLERKEQLAKVVAAEIKTEHCSWNFEPLRENLEAVLEKLR